MRILICDDDMIFLDRFTQTLETVFKAHKTPASFICCSSGIELFQRLSLEPTDVIFLDIDMPQLDGFAVAKQLQHMPKRPLLVFVSNHDSLVFDSFAYQPFWFLRKVRLEEVSEVVKQILEFKKRSQQYFDVVIDGVEKHFFISDIMYFESDGHYLNQTMVNGVARYKAKLADFEEKLDGCYFVRCHIGYLVNCRYIKVLEKSELLLTNGTRLPISRNKYQQTQKCFLRYMRSLRL